LLKSEDRIVSERFTAAAAAQWNLKLGWTLSRIEEAGSGVRATIAGTDGGEAVVDADIVLVATGRLTNADSLDVQAAGFDLEEDGRLAVDEFQRVLAGGSPAEGIWALGDVSSPYQLKHVANHEARVVTHNLEHPDDLRRSDHRFVPSAVFTRPQIASVGLTEEQARRNAESSGAHIVTVIQEYGTTAYGWAMEDSTGFVKLIADKATGHLLGAHIMGHEASILIQPLIQAMSFGLDASTMARGQYWIHPALTEVVENALLALGTDAPSA
jgi:mycothione reductase